MTWIDDELNRIKREKELCQHAQELRDAVWREIGERANEARGKAVQLLIVDADGIMIPHNPPKTLTVRVGRDGCSVESSNGIKFPLGYSGDSPSLMEPNSSRAVSIEEAARMILKPFLFGA